MAAATSVHKRGVHAALRYGVPWRALLIHAASIVFILWIVLPFAWVVLTSLMTEAESMSVPPHWIPDYITFDNYLSFINPALLVGKQRLVGGGAAIGAARAMLNSSIVALCKWITLMLRVFLPVARPGLVACAMFAFMSSWGEFLYALLFTSTMNSKPMPIIIASSVPDGATSPVLMSAGGVLAVTPPLV